MERSFKYQLGATVSLALSGESGTVIGRAQYLADETRYQIRYKAADGRQVEEWHGESSLA